MAHTQTPIEELLSICRPGEWKDFIFHLQTTMIENGYVETLTDSGRSDFAGKLQGLYNCFARLEQPVEQS